MNASKFATGLSAVLLISGCGGGGDADPASPGSGVGEQVYLPAGGGIWEGTGGAISDTRPVIGFISAGNAATGGEFYLSRGDGGEPDALFGTLSLVGSTVQADNATYYFGQRVAFAGGIRVRGRAEVTSGTRLAERIVANYTDPVSYAAPLPLTLSYSPLNAFPATQARIAGSYGGGSIFGSGWALTVSATGEVGGTYAGCTISGGTIRPLYTGSAVYQVAGLVRSGSDNCTALAAQNGIAFLEFNAAGDKTGIRIMTRDTATTRTLVLAGSAGDSPAQPPAGQQDAQGFWKGTLRTGGGGERDVNAVVLPGGAYFFYQSVGGRYDTLYGTLAVVSGGSTVSSSDGVYFASQQANASAYTSGLAMAGIVTTGDTFEGSFPDPTAGGSVARFTMKPDTGYVSAVPASVTRLVGQYEARSSGFGGTVMTLAVDGAGSINGTTSDGCVLTGSLAVYSPSVASRNLYSARLRYRSAENRVCPHEDTSDQLGIANAVLTTSDSVSGLRLLLASQNAITGTRFNTVFVGTRQ